MPHIHLLDDSVINQIAAGEVIERPASAVKELVENSLDSGATHIRIAIKRGGRELIQVQDNGCGIGENDLELSVLRHATSKLKNTEDLFKLSTNGFRGEALASIAAISRMTIESREKVSVENEGGGVGLRVFFEGGILKSKEEIALPAGTIISVSDLFFNTPVRAEFLKSNSSENSRILDLVIRLAIANPKVRFEYRADGHLAFLSAEGNLQTRLADALGTETAKSLLPVEWEESGVSVSGFVSAAEDLQVGKRIVPYIYLQKRPIYNGLIVKAINQAYSPYGEGAPIAVLFLDMPLQTFDVNVHPQKKEVRFSRENAVFLAVHHAIHNALQSNINYPSLQNIPEQTASRARDYAEISAFSGFENTDRTSSTEQIPFPELFSNQKVLQFADSTVPPAISNAAPVTTYLQIAKSYIVCESGNSVLFIDQNAAHKRILFEKALTSLQNDKSLESQELLFPETIEVPNHLTPILEEQCSNLKKLGFHLEHFGGISWQIRGAPIHLPSKFIGRALIKFLESFDDFSGNNNFQRLAFSWAKGSAIQSGTELSQDEMKFIVSELLSLQNPYETPQGGKIFMKMSVEDIKRWF